MVDSYKANFVRPTEIYRIDARLGEELAYIEKPYRDRALSLAARAIELNLPDDIRDIVLKEARAITQTGVRTAREREQHLWQRYLEDRREEDGELSEL